MWIYESADSGRKSVDSAFPGSCGNSIETAETIKVTASFVRENKGRSNPIIVWLLVLLAVYILKKILGLQPILPGPIALCWVLPAVFLTNKQEIYNFLRSPGAWKNSLLLSMKTIFALAIFFTLIMLAWKTKISVLKAGDFTSIFVYQFLLVAFPEEFFFRGFLQTKLSKNSRNKNIWKSILIASLCFGISHSVLQNNLLSLLIVFPGMLFGWLKEKTGNILSPVLVHGFCNTLLFYIKLV